MEQCTLNSFSAFSAVDPGVTGLADIASPLSDPTSVLSLGTQPFTGVTPMTGVVDSASVAGVSSLTSPAATTSNSFLDTLSGVVGGIISSITPAAASAAYVAAGGRPVTVRPATASPSVMPLVLIGGAGLLLVLLVARK